MKNKTKNAEFVSCPSGCPTLVPLRAAWLRSYFLQTPGEDAQTCDGDQRLKFGEFFYFNFQIAVFLSPVIWFN